MICGNNLLMDVDWVGDYCKLWKGWAREDAVGKSTAHTSKLLHSYPAGRSLVLMVLLHANPVTELVLHLHIHQSLTEFAPLTR